ncbi:SsrA-binding protein SmpB [Candidatus Aerophobetes bacterium]|uniref:SsrA-binding protein n=1 Tax=Aerophobetes bacterium TaxID=2030807 RepID=A0A662DG51_UNCAE|nr:SsrA-binding protein SmpB [Candidatus Aerophobetes bacterium]RLE13858.1 MAG: SsrA-binding protein [Candidatus Aerophobetes bacterium]
MSLIVNKRVKHEYEILESYEAGIVLKGSEVKSIREGRVSFTDSFVRIKNGEVWLCNLHIAPYSSSTENHDPKRDRKLLLHKKQITRLAGILSQRGLTLLPLRIYFKKNRAKVEVVLVKGKRKYDKREKLKRKDMEREMKREIKERERFS